MGHQDATLCFISAERDAQVGVTSVGGLVIGWTRRGAKSSRDLNANGGISGVQPQHADRAARRMGHQEWDGPIDP